MKRSILMIVFAALLAMPVAAVGQEAGDDPSFAPLPNEKREEIRKKVETLRVWRMTEALKLDDKTAAKFIPVISSLDQKRAELMTENMAMMRQIRLALDSGKPDEKMLKTAIEKMERNHKEMMQIREKEFEAMKEHLSVEQQARYIVFQREFQREVRHMINSARGGGRGRGPAMMGPGRGMGPGPNMRDTQ